ncbi:hypothetical protein [Paramuribaculum intestinale]|uniref:hypothetical protein n=1 Tax=Paramuribaculum intestinale TaxID=2094151 RepID=UPI0023C0B35A|nr:hypothetical protein [Paramuribaculum intestinale]MDE6524617.1 hypothetical protein [Paramuribaculum sp.]
MANKRTLKKQIRYICGDCAAECAMACEIIPGVDCDKLSEVICSLAKLQTESLARTTFSFDRSRSEFENAGAYRKARTAYNTAAFKKLRSEFNEQLLRIVKEMNSALPSRNKSEKAAEAQ